MWCNFPGQEVIIVYDMTTSYSGGVARTNAPFGEGAGAIILDDLRCGGLEETLLDCANANPLIHNCGHHEDAGVTCIQGI